MRRLSIAPAQPRPPPPPPRPRPRPAVESCASIGTAQRRSTQTIRFIATYLAEEWMNGAANVSRTRAGSEPEFDGARHGWLVNCFPRSGSAIPPLIAGDSLDV